MLRTRVIPVLLIKDRGVVKTVKFKAPNYIGDPFNALKIFNEKQVDEIVILNIDPKRQKLGPDFDFIRDMASECFMPMAYGGGISTLDQAKKLFNLGVEKVVLNTSALRNPALVSKLAAHCGSQSVLVSLDIKKSRWGSQQIYGDSGNERFKENIIETAKRFESLGAGELIVHSIDRDGTMKGYDLDLVKSISQAIDIPTVACGGAGNLNDFGLAVKEGQASAVAAGSRFVYHGKHNAVLINYPSQKELKDIFEQT